MATDREKAKEKAEKAFKDMIYAQLGAAAELNDKLYEKRQERIKRGKEFAEKYSDLDDEIRRTFKHDDDDDDVVDVEAETKED